MKNRWQQVKILTSKQNAPWTLICATFVIQGARQMHRIVTESNYYLLRGASDIADLEFDTQFLRECAGQKSKLFVIH